MSIDDKIYNDEDFIKSKKYQYSLDLFQESHPNGATNKTIAHALGFPEEKVEKIHLSAIMKLKKLFQG